MKTLFKDRKCSSLVLSFRVPAHFYKSVKREAKKLDFTLSDYLVAILISEMKTGIVKKDIEKRIESRNMFWSVFPEGKDIYRGTPEEQASLPVGIR